MDYACVVVRDTRAAYRSGVRKDWPRLAPLCRMRKARLSEGVGVLGLMELAEYALDWAASPAAG